MKVQAEYVGKIGGLFLKQMFSFSDELSLTPKQHDATRFDEEGRVKATKWASLYHVPLDIWRVDGELVRVHRASMTAKVDA